MSLNDKVVMKGEFSALVRGAMRKSLPGYEDEAIIFADDLIKEQASVIAVLLEGRSYNHIVAQLGPRDKRKVMHHPV